MWSTAGYFSTCSAAVNLILSPSTSLPRYCNKGRVLKEAKDRDCHLQQRKESEHIRMYCTCQHRGCCCQGAHDALCPFSGLSVNLSAVSWTTHWPIYSCTLSPALFPSQIFIYSPKWFLFVLLLLLFFPILCHILLYSPSFPVMTHIDTVKYPFIFCVPSFIHFLFISSVYMNTRE